MPEMIELFLKNQAKSAYKPETSAEDSGKFGQPAGSLRRSFRRYTISQGDLMGLWQTGGLGGDTIIIKKSYMGMNFV